jgi:hypothetical protein
LVGGPGALKSRPAWRQVYRSLEHGHAKNSCKDADITKFPKSIEDFANQFVAMQIKRHEADYDPYARFFKSEVVQDIETTKRTIENFDLASKKDKLAFCAFVLFRKPRT